MSDLEKTLAGILYASPLLPASPSITCQPNFKGLNRNYREKGIGIPQQSITLLYAIFYL
jgi:hypothetical protein